MARGDQIYVMRPLGTLAGVYQHHGIDCGDRSVIHYSKAGQVAEVARTSFEQFSWGNPVHPVHHTAAYADAVVIERATSRLGEQQYDLFTNNCEHFANWCKTGRSESAQLADFGFRLDHYQLSDLRRLVTGKTVEHSPEQAMVMAQRALGDVATAYNTLLTAQQTAHQEVDGWQRVAQTALARDRDDLARAALHRKVTAQKQADSLTSQLADLVDMQITLQRNRDRAAQQG
ncbi:lecithin retinol acyltransferase family protein [Nodosilinea sp. P-1105]|uniref:lecithin retinol acyltransferase family protein n=1 Tax=Nodosilinea sp. P-1105 TaxID=2546229 RepID=UPI00146AEEF5|nr:lecithin retinol acyltransferase family protein [Nodosilinea sp. P-1105]NMF85958.1 hypothetical protein [Nodosilinea sp. P-1105]